MTIDRKQYHREYMRDYRKTHPKKPPSPRQRARQAAHNRAYRERHPDRALAQKRSWTKRDRLQDPEPHRARSRAQYHKLTPEQKRLRSLKGCCRQRGITVEDYFAMLRRQKGACAVCREVPKGKIRLHIDHDHATGQVRGLLCLGCNVTLGYLERTPGLEKKLRAYLLVHRSIN